jgi:hypothetical protein
MDMTPIQAEGRRQTFGAPSAAEAIEDRDSVRTKQMAMLIFDEHEQ